MKTTVNRGLPKTLKPLQEPSFIDEDWKDYFAVFHSMKRAMATSEYNNYSSFGLNSSFGQFNLAVGFLMGVRKHRIRAVVLAICTLGFLVILAGIITSVFAARFETESRGFLIDRTKNTNPTLNNETQCLGNELSQISDLHRSGSLTEQEFKEAKEKLLKRSA